MGAWERHGEAFVRHRELVAHMLECSLASGDEAVAAAGDGLGELAVGGGVTELGCDGLVWMTWQRDFR